LDSKLHNKVILVLDSEGDRITDGLILKNAYLAKNHNILFKLCFYSVSIVFFILFSKSYTYFDRSSLTAVVVIINSFVVGFSLHRILFLILNYKKHQVEYESDKYGYLVDKNRSFLYQSYYINKVNYNVDECFGSRVYGYFFYDRPSLESRNDELDKDLS